MSQSSLQVERYQRRVVDRTAGYLPVEKVEHYQQLVQYTHRKGWLFSATRREVIDEEVIPDDVIISLGCFGDTGSWRSRFAKHIS